MPRFQELIREENRPLVQGQFGVDFNEPVQELGRGITQEEASSEFKNYEGVPTFAADLHERTVQVLTTNTLSETFYASKAEITDETLAVIEEIRTKDPEFLAKALVYAHEQGLLHFVPTIGLAALSTADDKTLFTKAFPRIITNPDNLREFVGICKTGRFRKGFGGVAVKAVKQWLQGLTEYHALKYSGDAKSDQKKGKNNLSLRDVIRMARPTPATPELEQRLGWIVKGKNQTELDKNSQLAAYEALKKAQTDEERVELIATGRLPWEVVIPAVPKMTREIWGALLRQMPYFALLRNINNLRKHGVLDSDANVEYVVQRLTDKQAILKSKVFPFRFFAAYIDYTGQTIGTRNSWSGDDNQEKIGMVDSRITAALEVALEISADNLPELEGAIAIGSDVSGSMRGRISDKGKTRYIDICGVFTGALLKKATGRVYALPFEGQVVNIDLSAGDRILETTRKLAEICGGGTAVGAPIQRLLNTRQKVDVFIGITDGEDWAYDTYDNGFATRGSFLKLWRTYRQTINPQAQAFLIRIDPYQHRNNPVNEPGIHFISGWSDSVLGFIATKLKDDKSQIDAINQIQL